MTNILKHAPAETESGVTVVAEAEPADARHDSDARHHAADALAELIASRRTIHKFLPESVPQDLLIKSIDTARWAPNHKLTEPWRFYLIGPETAAAMASLVGNYVAEKKGSEIARAKKRQWEAVPSLVVVTCRKSGNAFREKEDYAATCCAIQNMSLYLWEAGVGMKWSTAGVTTTPAFYDLLGIDPDEEETVGVLWCGFPADIPAKSRKAVNDIIQHLP